MFCRCCQGCLASRDIAFKERCRFAAPRLMLLLLLMATNDLRELPLSRAARRVLCRLRLLPWLLGETR
jgi:hypothetical protein